MPGLKAIWQKLRREGLAGLGARLRYRRAPGLALGGVRPVQLPLRLRDRSGVLEQALRETRLAACFAAEGALLITDPDPQQGHAAAAALFTRPDYLTAFLSGQDAPLPGLMLLVPDAASLKLARAAGYHLDQVMLVAVNDGPAALGAGLLRWLVAAQALDPADLAPELFPELAALQPGAAFGQGLCLSLPESPERRAGFRALNLAGLRFFPGLRQGPGWQGAAQSYALIARGALARGAVPLTLCEDDLQPCPGFQQRLRAAEAVLAARPDWDVFSGLISDLAPGAKVSEVIALPGQKLVFLNFTTGMVFNICRESALQHLAAWSPGRGGIRENSIDTWLGQMPGLRVATTLPFLAGHNSEQRSTIFGFSNRRYDALIRHSEARLAQLVGDFEAQAGGPQRRDQ